MLLTYIIGIYARDCINLIYSEYGTDESFLQFRLGKSLSVFSMIISCNISKLLTSMYVLHICKALGQHHLTLSPDLEFRKG